MSGELCLRNRQRTREVNLRLLRQLVQHLLRESLALEDFDLTIHLVNARTMAQLNKTHLDHAGSTDVITLDYSTDSSAIGAPASGPARSKERLKNARPEAGAPPSPAGEIFVCMDEALSQSQRFRTSWQSELVRYIVHGVLHLLGYDDLKPAVRRRMKREEGRLVRELAREFHLSKLQRKPRVSA